VFQVPFQGTDEEIAAATKLQAIQRGRAARADVRKLKDDRDAAASAAIETATAVAEAEAEAASARDAERVLEDALEGTEDEQAAATKLQAIQRGRLARARVAQLKAEHLAAVARVAGADAAIEFAGTADEHIAATKVQAIQRGRVARAQLAAEKAAAAAKLADVDAKLAAKEGSENDAEEDPDLEALETERVEAAEALEAAATKLQAMRRGRSAREHVEKLRAEKQAMETSAGATAATAADAEAEAAAAAEEEETLDALVVTGDEDEKTLVAKAAAVRRGIAARARVATLRAEQFSAEARAHDAEVDAVDAEHQSADEEEEEKDAAPTAGDGDPAEPPETPRGDAEDAPAAASANEAHEESFDEEEEMWMTDEEKAALAARVAAKARRKAKTLHVKRAYEYAAATSTLARIDARLASDDQKEADRISGDGAMSAAEKLAALIETRRARDALEAAQAETVETDRAETEAAEAVADEHFAAPPDTTEATEEVPVEEAPAEEAPAEEATEDTPEDEAGRLVADRLEALRASSAARAALEAAPDPDAPVPRKEYEPEEMRRAPGEDELPRDAVTMHHSFGFESVKRNNLHYLSEEVIIFTVGALVQTVHLGTGEQTYLYGIDGEGVGFVVVHPEKTHFALGEKGVNPSVYIYETQTLKLKRVLVGGTERAYSCGRFSNDGSKLATVGGYPDFWLTVWDWREEAIVLRSKAFSQEVFDVTFSPFFEGQLTTSGTGHIRFWKMAETFTGLKLQGDIGRFGNEDLSDVAGYAEMPDGKVLSGTESGRLLMWDGGLIRAVLLRPGGKPCHDGMIELIKLDAESGRVYTAGADGYVRVWDYQTLNDAEPGEDSAEAHVDALDEFLIPRGEPFLAGGDEARRNAPDPAAGASEPASVKSLIMTEPDHWLVQDEKGGVVKVPLAASGAPEVEKARRVLDFHAGAINALEASRVSDHVVTAGEDGSVRVFAYAEKREVFAARFDAPATALSLAPPAVDEEGRVAIVGFGDGVARALLRCADAWKLVDAVKPHVGAVTCAAYAPAAKAGARPLLATAGEDGKVWFFACEREKGTGLSPIGFAEAPGSVTALAWADSGDAVLVGCASGHVVELAAPSAGSVDATRTFKFEPRRVRAYAFKRPRASAASVLAAREGAPPEITPEMDAADVIEAKAARKRFDERAAELQEEMDEAEATATYPVTHLAYDETGGFELCVGGEARGKVFACSLEHPEKPPAARDAHGASVVTALKTRQGASHALEVSGAENGTVRVSRRGVEKHWRREVHDGHRGAVSGVAVSRCETYLVTAAKDGSLFAQTLGPELRGGAETLRNGETLQDAQAEHRVPSLEADAMPAARDVGLGVDALHRGRQGEGGGGREARRRGGGEDGRARAFGEAQGGVRGAGARERRETFR
jgi:WD40 repeat protein